MILIVFNLEQTVHLANVMPEVQQCERNFNQAIEKKDYDAGMSFYNVEFKLKRKKKTSLIWF